MDETGKAWRSDGHFWGELVDENYILRPTTMATPAARAIRSAPATPATPATRAMRAARAARSGYIDVLAEL